MIEYPDESSVPSRIRLSVFQVTSSQMNSKLLICLFLFHSTRVFCSINSQNGKKSSKTKYRLDEKPTIHPVHAHYEFENDKIAEYISLQTRARIAR